ncbi:MAG: TonB-dependent receptor; Outer membrane receptor for ferrienterochelin and colicins [uncultured Cytophagales bacterium]|uniref:TonB-dependent receptor Outer membrane receptor for ferrienterochelin and colicins n=1 Tax=uncultured Cytophagales bacterium TaxID=158755 RepID=A0A6J4I4L5_9SPHI|nr:MAG: TonB-dependent receptor; Outer membrane receptor for ferrienterochelin and colicins [uncultured Cytophagales bacterium]
MNRIITLCSLLLGLLWLGVPAARCQSVQLTGKVTAEADGAGLAGVSVVLKGSTLGTATSQDGSYALTVPGDAGTLVFSFVGFLTQEVPINGRRTISIRLAPDVKSLSEVTVVGTRNLNRSATETPVAIDLIPIAQITNSVGQIDVNQLLQFVAPSFNSNRQSGSDGSDHIDPATLRGLGPDQTLVLINGKRRHQSSLINLFGTRGRGNTGTDLNAIPAAAIERIEILRDGASAQYGSDAIAGVINIVLKTDVNKVSANVNTGIYSEGDGETLNANVNYGVKLLDRGFLNLTADYQTRGYTNRPADPVEFPENPRNQFGEGTSRNLSGFLNAALPLGASTELYAFGGVNGRHSKSYAWTRSADSDRNVTEIYPNGFDPLIGGRILDYSASFGLRTKWRGWNVDLNNTFGSNRFEYEVENTLNASLGAASPTRFDAGGFSLRQNTTGINFSKAFEGVASGLNVAYGAEFRVDNYQIFAGQEASWRRYDNLEDRPGGSQGFPGFRPANELGESRTNVGGYVDAELDVTEQFLVTAAARYEHYSDFGGTLNGKLSARYKFTDAFLVRGSVSTGFRAPSLAQVYFNTTFTNFVAGVPVDQIIASNTSPIARAVGIPPLKQEKAQNYSLGFTAKPLPSLSLTVDGYWVDIRDRIVLTAAFSDEDEDIGEILQGLNVGNAQFFTNALDTRTRGLDVILTHTADWGNSRLTTSLAGNFNRMELGEVKTTPRLANKEDIYFDDREKSFLLASAPGSKINLTFDYKLGRFGTNLRFVRFSSMELVNWHYYEDDVTPGVYTDRYDARVTTDLALSYDFTDNVALTAGASNLFDVYPDRHDPNYTESGGMWDPVQMGFGGRFYFARLRFRF